MAGRRGNRQERWQARLKAAATPAERMDAAWDYLRASVAVLAGSAGRQEADLVREEVAARLIETATTVREGRR